MTDDTLRTAACGCGALSVDTTGAPKRVLLCSCRACQGRTGTGIGVSAYWAKDAIKTSGPSTAWTRDCQGSRHAEHHFCPTCGTTLWWTADFAQGLIGVAGGAFEDSSFLKPEIAYWACRRPAWLADIHTVPTLDRQTS